MDYFKFYFTLISRLASAATSQHFISVAERELDLLLPVLLGQLEGRPVVDRLNAHVHLVAAQEDLDRLDPAGQRRSVQRGPLPVVHFVHVCNNCQN